MTDDSVRENVADELRLAASALRSAEALLQLELTPDAASRIYYAAFHAARALLYSIGIEAHSHSGIRTLVSRHFVREGRFAAERMKDLSQLEALREAGDYDSAFILGVAELRPELARAQRFVDEVTTLLRAAGAVP